MCCYVIPIQNIIGKLCLVPVGDTGTIPGLSRTVCAQPSWAHLATTSGVQAMVVRCGSSTRGPWDGPVICNGIRLVFDTDNPAEGAKHVHFYHYLLEQKNNEENEDNLIYKG